MAMEKSLSLLRASVCLFVSYKTGLTIHTTGRYFEVQSLLWSLPNQCCVPDRCVCMLSHSSPGQIFVTLCTIACRHLCPWDSPRQEYWSGLPWSSSWPRDWTSISMSPALADRFFTTSPTWEALPGVVLGYTKPALWPNWKDKSRDACLTFHNHCGKISSLDQTPDIWQQKVTLIRVHTCCLNFDLCVWKK